MIHSRTRDAKDILARYAVAVCSAGAGWALRLTFTAALHARAPYVTFVPAIAFSAWFGGRGPGILATALSVAAVFYSVILPFQGWRWPTLSDIIGAIIFAIVSIFIIFEVARRAEAEAELAAAKDKAERGRDLLSTTLASIGDAVIAADADGKVTFLNAVAQALTGWSQADAAGKAMSEVFVIRNETTGLPVENPAERAMREGIVIGLANHTVLVSKDGRVIPIEDSAAPIRDGQQRVLGVVLVFRDVTERRRAEEALQRSEERLKLALDAGQIGVWDWDVVQNRVEWSELVHDIHGLERGQFAGGMEDFAKLIHPEDRGRITTEILAALQQNKPYDVEFRVIHPNGDVHWVATTALIFPDEKGEAKRMLGATTDISARKKAEAHLLQQWHTFDTALSYTPDFLYIFNREGRFTYVNRALLSLWQKPLEEAVGKNCFELGYPAELAERLERQIQEVIQTKQPVQDETPFTGATGEPRHYEYIFVPVLDASGGVEAVAGSSRDVTERNRNEEALRKSNEELRRVNRELEEFAYVASHDLQEPLRMVNIYTQIILKEVGVKDGEAESAKLGKYADFVRQGVTRMEALIQDLLTFSRAVHDDELPIATAHLSAALDEALYVLKNQIEESGCCITAPELPTVRGDTAQLAHVFQNLISNALKYRKNSAAPEIEISFEQSGNDWVISVADNGIGFEPQYAERIFGLFKRLHKEEYPGTGLGLAICRRIVERYGGRTWAEGRPGAGATFYFSLPMGLAVYSA